ncbi:hypothetical protein KSS87_023521, partial [Heliosperma pusillum]
PYLSLSFYYLASSFTLSIIVLSPEHHNLLRLVHLTNYNYILSG